MKLTEKKASLISTVLVYGPPKTGKTELVGRLAEKYNLLWFDLENGGETLTKLPVEWQERIEYIGLPDTRSFPVAIETCLKVIKGNPVDICQQHGKVMCPSCKKDHLPHVSVNLKELSSNTIVVFDSLTQLTTSAIAHITKNEPDDYKLKQDDWGNLGKLMDIFLSHVQQASFNVVCISHETEVNLEDGAVKIVPTAGTRNFSRNTAKYFGHVVYAEVKNKKHIFTSSTTGAMKVIAGSRTDVKTEAMEAGASLLPIFDRGSAPTQGQVAASKLSSLIKKA